MFHRTYNYISPNPQGPNFAFGLVMRKLKDAKKEVQDEIRSLDLSSIKTLVNAAEPIDPKVILEFLEEFKGMGLSPDAMCPCYGLAENTLNASIWGNGLLLVDKAALECKQVVVQAEQGWRQPYTPIEGTVALLSCGSVDHGVTFIIVDPDTLIQCPADQVGEIWINCDSKAFGYFNRPDSTAETFQAKLKDSKGPLSKLEFLRTGDSGFIHKRELYFCGRIKDIIIINGLNYYPQDMERTAEMCHNALRPGCSAAFALKQDSDLTECAVFVAEVKLTWGNYKYSV